MVVCFSCLHQSSCHEPSQVTPHPPPRWEVWKDDPLHGRKTGKSWWGFDLETLQLLGWQRGAFTVVPPAFSGLHVSWNDST